MKNTIELAAELIRRAACVGAHALLKDECAGKFHTNEELAAIPRDYIGGGCL